MRTLLTTVLIVCVGLVADAALAQGSRADYDRADRLRRDSTALVRDERLDPIWLPGGSLIVRLAHDAGHRHVRIDGTTGDRRDAFDHDALAHHLGVDPDSLPIRSVRFREKDRRVEIIARAETPESTTYSVLLSGTGLRQEPPTPPVSLRPGDFDASSGGDVELVIEFENEHSAPVTIDWLDRNGRAHRYAEIRPGETHRQPTYRGHVWRVTDDNDQELGRFQAPARDALVRVDETPRPVAPAHYGELAPDHRRVVYQEGWNLRLRDEETGEERPFTDDGTEQSRYTDRVRWSYDGRWLAAVRRTPGAKRTITLTDAAPADQVQPRLHTLDYAKPGDAIDQEWVCLFDTETGNEIPVDRSLCPNPWSIGPIWWSSDSAELLFVYHERGHRVRRIIGIDAASGAARALVDEVADTFIDYSQKTHVSIHNDGDRVVWMSERSGWNHLYLVDRRAGTTRAITDGPWLVRRVLSTTTDKSILFEAMGVDPDQDPYHIHVGRVPIDGGTITWLTGGDGTHSLQFGGATYLDTWSRVDQPQVHELRLTQDGSLICEIARADASALLAGRRTPERFAVAGRDLVTPIWGVIHTPTNFDPSKRYPVVEQIYAGPHGHHVPKGFRAWHSAAGIAELGFVVVQIDGMGTNWRSKAFHDVCWKNIGDAGFPDRIRWIKAAAASRPWMDLSRVGIYGGSAGGQNAMRALLFHNDFYHAAVADCGCHDNRMDKIWWNEAWMGWPVDASYERSSNVVHAHRLKGDLMLIVGALDRNVDPMSTMQVVEALTRADKDFELVVLPSAGHGAAGTAYGARRQQDFLVKTLMGQTPRWE